MTLPTLTREVPVGAGRALKLPKDESSAWVEGAEAGLVLEEALKAKGLASVGFEDLTLGTPMVPDPLKIARFKGLFAEAAGKDRWLACGAWELDDKTDRKTDVQGRTDGGKEGM